MVGGDSMDPAERDHGGLGTRATRRVTLASHGDGTWFCTNIVSEHLWTMSTQLR